MHECLPSSFSCLRGSSPGFVFRERIEFGMAEADARSILSILLLAAACGTRVRVSAEGSDEEQAVFAVCEYLEGR